MSEPAPTPEIPDPPQLQKMVSEARNQVRVLRALVLKNESTGDASKARKYQLAAQRMESAQHVLEAIQHWFGPDLDDKKVWHVLSVLLPGPAPSVPLVEALKNFSMAPRAEVADDNI